MSSQRETVPEKNKRKNALFACVSFGLVFFWGGVAGSDSVAYWS